MDIGDAPSLITHPISRNIVLGNPVAFEANATGSAPLSIQWQKDGVDINGATNSIYSIASTISSNAGTYRLKAFSPYGVAYSQGAILRVGTPPTIVSQPQDINGTAGVNVTFSVDANGTAPLSYQWVKDGGAILEAIEPTLSYNNNNKGNLGAYKDSLLNKSTSHRD